MLQECKEGDHGDPAAEIKIAVISLQNTAPGICPYFTLAGLPQSINENNDFGTEVMIAWCAIAPKIQTVLIQHCNNLQFHYISNMLTIAHCSSASNNF